MSRSALCSLVLCGLILSVELAYASEPADTSTVAKSMIYLKRGNAIKVKQADGNQYVGRFAGTLVDSLYLEIHGQQNVQVVPTTTIDRLWKRGRATGRGALYGTLIGALAGVAMVAIWNEYAEGSEMEVEGAYVYVAGGFFGAATGALLGAGIGTLAPKWSLKYKRDDGHPNLSIQGEAPLPAPPPPVAAAPRERPPHTATHLIGLYIGASRNFTYMQDAQAGIDLNYFFKVSPILGVGADAGFVAVDVTYPYYSWYPEETHGYDTWSTHAKYASALGRVSTQLKDFLPYAVAGGGIGDAGDGIAFQYTLGGGIGYRLLSHMDAMVEVRWRDFFGWNGPQLLSLRGGLGFWL